MNLIPVYCLDDQGLRLHCLLNNYVAYDPDTKTYLRCSAGRRKPGRRIRYIIGGDAVPATTIYAWHDASAIDLANKALTPMKGKPC